MLILLSDDRRKPVQRTSPHAGLSLSIALFSAIIISDHFSGPGRAIDPLRVCVCVCVFER